MKTCICHEHRTQCDCSNGVTSFFPPSGLSRDEDGTDPKWVRWFAWFPVAINVWEVDEIKREGFSFFAWFQWVECRLAPDMPPPNDFPMMQYRWPVANRK